MSGLGPTLSFEHETGAGARMDSLPVPRPAPSPDQPQGMCLDKGYDFDEVRRTLDEFYDDSPLTSVQPKARRPRPSKEKLGSKPGTLVVVTNAAHSWLETACSGWRRILGSAGIRSPDNYIAFLHFACALTALRAAGLLG